MAISEFNGQPLVAGSIQGTKSFVADRLGRLHGAAQQDYIYRPGENIAQCGDYSLTGPDHGLEDCSHGFYAYSDGKVDYSDVYTDTISGVIEGYGVTQVGTRGFRSEKCKIIAVCDPSKEELKTPLWFKPFRLIQWLDYKNEDFLTFTQFASFIGSFACLFGFLWNVIPDDATGTTNPTLGTAFGIGMGLLVLWLIANFIAFNTSKHSRYEYRGWKSKVDTDGADVFELVQRNYPDVKVFTNYDEMVSAHDILTEERKLTELTPDNPNFWEVQI